MSETPKGATSRRAFIKGTGTMAASALAASAIPYVHAQGTEEATQIALVGCGGRGGGAASNALSVTTGPTKVVALADVFPDRIKGAAGHLGKNFAKKFEATPERQFIGLDAYKQAMDCLKPGDVVILTTPPAFRWVHFKYAIQKGLNVFMEKPTTVDGPSTKKMLALAKESVEKKLKVGVGLMCRHCDARRALFDKIKEGAIGDVLALRAYRMHGPIGFFSSGPKPGNITDTMYQIQRFHSFLWASGGCYSDFYIHNIDECCWMKDAWPVKAQATGGRHYRGDTIDQNFDSYSVEYTFADGTKLFLYGRCVDRAWSEFASYASGTKGCAQISIGGHHPAKCHIHKGHDNDNKGDIAWAYDKPEPDPYQLEWNRLIEAIRTDKPHNECERGAMASLVTSMGRMAAHTGQVVTLDQILNSDHEFAPDLENLKADGPAPLQPGPDGKYPVPMPGKKTREY
jgi:predicted dehydrogenase